MDMTRPIRLALALVLLSLALPASGAAASGSLDPNFATGGKVRTAVSLGTAERALVALVSEPRGSTLVATQRQLLRYRPDGRLDPRFGRGGILTLDKVEGLDFAIADLEVDSEGRIVVFGTAEDPNTTYTVTGYTYGYVHPSYVAVLRLDASGKPDPSFGSNGVMRTDLGQPQYLEGSLFPAPPADGRLNPVSTTTGTVDARGRPLLIAARYTSISTEAHSVFGFEGRLLARLTASGDLDREFGAGGVVTLPGSENDGIALAAEDESPLTWGNPFSGGYRQPTAQIRAFTKIGGFDQRFGRDGLRILRGGGATDFVVDGSGRLLVLQGFGPRCRVVGLRADGTPDRGYGKNGRATMGLPRGSISCGSIALDRKGGAFVVGLPVFTGKGPQPSQRPTIAFRLGPSGAPDRSFGRAGWVRTGLGPGTKLAMPLATVDPRGRLLVAAGTSLPEVGSSVVLFRYLPDR